ncbi:MAG: MerR family transcriptional regulator [Polyangiaceae bacterium]|nr:MerR family transcriptional regulator [Polyangiaceae bacterium]MBK8937492.1 MerR family transcriptional regulator [Polyangiaceae bacterium]
MTGVPTATLRAWERRYGVPSPGRTASAYRLYSEREVERVRRMKELIDKGMSASDAARAIGPLEPEPAEPSGDPYAEVCARIVAAAAALDLGALQLEIRRALSLDSAPAAFERVLRPAMVTIGDQWHRGEVSTAGEHLATHVVSAATLDLLRLIPIEPGAPGVLLGCFAEEQHVLPLYGAAIELASWGYRPMLMGGRCPPSAIARAVDALSPSIVGLSVTVPPAPPAVARELVEAYADACGTAALVVGGAGAAALAEWVEARGGVVADGTAGERKAALARALAVGRGGAAALTGRRRDPGPRPRRSPKAR